MSQNRQKKQLSMLDNVKTLSDHQLRDALKRYNVAPGPITESTRNIYRKKLASLLEDTTLANESTVSNNEEQDQNKSSAALKPFVFGDNDDDDDDDTSDEDYVAREEEDEETEESSEEDDNDDAEDEEESESEIIKLLEEDEVANQTKLSNTSRRADDLSTSVLAGSANGISKGIVLLVTSFFVVIFSYYLYATKQSLFDPLKPYKNITKQMLVLLVLSPLGYIVYKTIAYLRLRRREELQRVCGLVNDALELLQSPDNPRAMPILHIRDTLLTPSERKGKKMTELWSKAVKFVEEHESRVKVELVNIDGEDFRAWKWIGTKKL